MLKLINRAVNNAPGNFIAHENIALGRSSAELSKGIKFFAPLTPDPKEYSPSMINFY